MQLILNSRKIFEKGIAGRRRSNGNEPGDSFSWPASTCSRITSDFGYTQQSVISRLKRAPVECPIEEGTIHDCTLFNPRLYPLQLAIVPSELGFACRSGGVSFRLARVFMNLPNQLTVLRLILSFVFLGTMSLAFPHSKTVSLLIFAVAAITDFLDGYLARKHHLITAFGKLMDPLADKVLMAAGFIMLIPEGLVPAWIVVVILAREFLVTGLRLVASSEGLVLAAENLGKYKTIIQIVTILYFLICLASGENNSLIAFLGPLFETKITGPAVFGRILIWGSLFLTVLSGFNYLWKNRRLVGDF